MYFWRTDGMMHKVTNPSERIEEIKMTIWKGTLRHRRITTGIRCKNQEYGQETKSQYVCICDLVFTKFYCLLLLFRILESIIFILSTSNYLIPEKCIFDKAATDPWQYKCCSSALTMRFSSTIIVFNKIAAAGNHKTVHLMIWFIKYRWCCRVGTMNNSMIERHRYRCYL